jgi:hypothetical protein
MSRDYVTHCHVVLKRMDDPTDERLRQKGYLPGQEAPEEAARLVRLNMRDEAARRRQAPGEWDSGHVYARIVEALGVLGRTPMQVRPRGHATAWPRYAYSHADLVAQADSSELERFMRARNKIRIPPSADEITRADEAVLWCMQYLGDRPDLARAVLLSAGWHLSGANVQEECRRRKMNRRTFYRHAAQGLGLITRELVRRKVRVS